MQELKARIREIPDWPKKGILFYDVTTLLKDPDGFQQAIAALITPFSDQSVDLVIGIEARGFIFAPTVAYALKAGFVPVRKPGKLPWETVSESYELEYGTDSLDVHADAVAPGDTVLIVDDVLATGGTAAATARLVERLGGHLAGLAFVVELGFLGGRGKLTDHDILSLITV